MKKKLNRMSAEFLYKLKFVRTPEISPDGKYVVFSIEWINKGNQKKYSNIWITPVDKPAPEQFTFGKHIDTRPGWSPDGKSIAFISNRDDEKQSQIYIIPFKGGEARKITNLQGTIQYFEWSPDSKKILFSFVKKDKKIIEMEKDPRKKKLGIVERHVKRLFYKLDGAGFVPEEKSHIWIVDVKTKKTKQITEGDKYSEEMPRWSPDGKNIIFVSNRTEEPDSNPDAMDFYIIPAKGGKFTRIDLPFGQKFLPSFSPSGKFLAYYGKEGKGKWWKNTSLWVFSFENGKVENLTKKYDINVSANTINDTGGLEFVPPIWSSDEKEIYFQVSQYGSTVLKAISTSTKQMVDVIEQKGVVGSPSFDKKKTKVAYFYGDMFNPGDIYYFDIKSMNKKRLTKVNDKLLSRINPGKVEEIWVKGKAGNKIHGWILLPPDFDEKKKYPAILEIHGGPRVQYGNFFMHEFFFLAANNYVVFFSNPRGSQGYGEKHSKAIWNNWGTVDYEDLIKFTEFVEKKPYIDKNRLGVTGGSYGGYMTNWIITHTHKFAAAVTQRSVSNLLSMWGTSDFNWAFQYEFGEKPPWEDVKNYLRMSPVMYVKNAKTPTLVIHSENDLRCPIEQGEQMFVALKRAGVETEMVRFPDEFHGLSRNGRTDRRIARLKHILRWFDKYLKNKK